MRECIDARITPGMKEIEIVKMQEEIETCNELAEQLIRLGSADKAQKFIDRAGRLNLQIKSIRVSFGEDENSEDS